MRRLRAAVFWCHLVTGVAVGVVVLTMSATGVLLTYQRQLTTWAELRGLDGAPPAPGARRLSVDEFVRCARGAAAGSSPASPASPASPTAVTWRAGSDAPVEVAFGRDRRVFVNAYSGEVLGEGSRRARAFFRATTDWHRWLGAGERGRAVGRAITGAANLGFLFLVVSGFYLWWPRQRTRAMLRNVALFRRGLRGKARDFNWHNAIGLWSAVPLFVVVLSGVVISYPWASSLAYRLAGEQPPSAAASPAPPASRDDDAPPSLTDVDALLARAEQRMPGWRTITLQLPRSGTAPLVFTLDAGSGGQPQARAQLTLDRATGRELRWEPFGALSPGRRLRSVLRFAHTGEVLGLAGQTVAGLVSLGATVLVWTGLALAWRRFRSWRRRLPAGAPALAR